MPEINVADKELEDLMAQLEMETGVAVAPSPAPVVAPKPAVATEEPLPDDELLAALEESSTVEIKTVSLKEVVAKAAADEVPATNIGALSATPLSVEDELAGLEAELGGEPAGTVLTTGKVEVAAVKELEVVQQVSDNDGRGESFIPGIGIIHDPATDPAPAVETPKPAAPAGDSGPKVATELQIFTDPKDFVVTTSINDVDLDRCMIEQNALRATYGTRAARAAQQYGRLKLKFEILEATLYEEYRRLAAEAGEKVTEKALEGRVKTDKRWGKAKLLIIDAEALADIEKALVESLKDRKDMLVQLGADRRGELQGQVRTMMGQNSASQQREYAQSLLKEQMSN